MSANDFSTFVIVFRETLEAALVVGIVLAFLARAHAGRYMKRVLLSAAAAIGASFAVAWIFESAFGAFEGAAAQIFEGVVALVAAAVLTHMIVWMQRQTQNIKFQVEQSLDIAVKEQDLIALFGLPFFAVLREGAETILFLKAAALQSGSALSVLPGLLGFGLALVLVTAIFWLGKRIPLRLFFQSTSVLLLFMAAGLLAYGVHELEEAGWIPPVIAPVWNINHLLNDKEGAGAFMKALFGYNGNPSLVEVICYFSYLSVFSVLLWRWRPRSAAPAARVGR